MTSSNFIFPRTGSILPGHLASGIIKGSTGSTDNAILRADGTGGVTAQGSVPTIADTTGAISGGDGTVSLPGYAFLNDTDCGLYRIGTNNVGIATNGTKAIDIGTSQNTTFSKAINVNVTTTAVSANSANQTIIGVTDTSLARTITLLTADMVAGRIVIVKDQSGVAGTNNITVDTEGAELIDGAASVAISTNYGFRQLYSDGTNWFVIGSA